MILCESILISIILIMGFYVTTTDIRKGIIQNKVLIKGFVSGLVINGIYYCFYAKEFRALYFINLFAMCLISILLYRFHFWAAGDSKLLICLTTLLPARFYDIGNKTNVPALTMLIFIFLLAYFHVIGDTIVHIFKKKKKYSNVMFSHKVVLQLLKNYVISMLYLGGLTKIFLVVLQEIYKQNQLFFTFLNIFIALLIQKCQFLKKWYSLVGIGVWNIVYNYRFGFQGISIKSYILLLGVLVVRYFLSWYNYEEIPTSEIKKGMVLSYGTVAKFLPSKVKNLPHHTNEDMSSRLKEEQVDAIKRWEKSKYGEDTVIIVRKIPFAIFIVLGTVIFLGIRIIK